MYKLPARHGTDRMYPSNQQKLFNRIRRASPLHICRKTNSIILRYPIFNPAIPSYSWLSFFPHILLPPPYFVSSRSILFGFIFAFGVWEPARVWKQEKSCTWIGGDGRVDNLWFEIECQLIIIQLIVSRGVLARQNSLPPTNARL